MSGLPDPRGTSYLEYTSNGDGTHNGLRAIAWLYWSQTGKVLSETEVQALWQEGERRAAAKRANAAKLRTLIAEQAADRP